MPVAKRPDKYEAPSWECIHELCVQLADQVRRSKYKPDLLVAVARGGLVPGRLLSDLLEKTDIATIKVEHYVDLYRTTDKPEITHPLPIEVKGKKILIVDDIADSGYSLKLVKEHLLKRGAKDVKICSMYFKPWSVTTPDFFARETDAWVCFPHETLESIRKIYLKLKKKGKTKKEIEEHLLRIGINPLFVRKFLPRVSGRKN